MPTLLCLFTLYISTFTLFLLLLHFSKSHAQPHVNEFHVNISRHFSSFLSHYLDISLKSLSKHTQSPKASSYADDEFDGAVFCPSMQLGSKDDCGDARV